jgi:hypothetical protein
MPWSAMRFTILIVYASISTAPRNLAGCIRVERLAPLD